MGTFLLVILSLVILWLLGEQPWRAYLFIVTHPRAYRRALRKNQFVTAVKAVIGPDTAQVPLVVYNTLQRTITFAAYDEFMRMLDLECTWVDTVVGRKLSVLAYSTELRHASAFGDVVVQLVSGFDKSSVEAHLWHWAVGRLIQKDSTLFVPLQSQVVSMLAPAQRHKAAIDVLELRRYADERRRSNASATH